MRNCGLLPSSQLLLGCVCNLKLLILKVVLGAEMNSAAIWGVETMSRYIAGYSTSPEPWPKLPCDWEERAENAHIPNMQAL